MLIYVIGMVLIQAYAIIRFLIPSKKSNQSDVFGLFSWALYLALCASASDQRLDIWEEMIQ